MLIHERMKHRAAVSLLLTCSCFAAAPLQPAGLPLWAYGYIELPSAPADYSTRCLGTRPLDCDRPGGLPTDPQNTLRTLPGSEGAFTVAQISYRYGPADWFPGDHPPMPEVVARGKEAIGMRACALCHLPNGKGLMQNGGVAGLPAAYILQQLADFKSGRRSSADRNKANAFEMAAIARNLSDAEATAAAEYFASIPFTRWMRVVESTTVPKFTATANGLFLKTDDDATEPLGQRLIELPESTYQTNMLRNPRSGFVVYAPPGSLKKGELLSKECGVCHGADLRGLGIIPPIAGRSPSYIARQLFDMQRGARNSDLAQTMKPSVEKLTETDLIAIAAYVASLPP
jgi:cytochrome c553